MWSHLDFLLAAMVMGVPRKASGREYETGLGLWFSAGLGLDVKTRYKEVRIA